MVSYVYANLITFLQNDKKYYKLVPGTTPLVAIALIEIEVNSV